MDINGLAIADFAGYHPDDWCEPILRCRLIANCTCSEFRFWVWLPLSNDTLNLPDVLSVSLNGGNRMLRAVTVGQSTEIIVPVRLSPGQELSFQVECGHAVQQKGDDKRDLSFKLLSLSLL